MLDTPDKMWYSYDNERKVINMRNYEEMMNEVASRFGLEDKAVIKFCAMCETAKTADDDRKIVEAYGWLISYGVDNEEDDEDDNYDDDYGDYDGYDECGFNPYAGCYDYDC